MRNRLSSLAPVIALGALVLAAACSSSSAGASNDDVCSAQAKARCGKTQECSSYFWQTRYGGDDATCEAVEKQNCMFAFSAPSTGKTVASTQACVSAFPSWSCSDWLANNFPAACVPPAGGLGNAATCQLDGQCESGFCSIPLSFGCGKCAPKTMPGDSCASGGVCAADATGQYCPTATEVCTLPSALGAACDNSATICAGGLNCAGLSSTSNGTCQPGLTTLGADCVPVGQGGVGCDRHHSLYCDPPTKKCVAIAYAVPGQPCGAVVAGVTTPCVDQGYCLIPTGQKAGTCVAVAADGAPCDTANGPICAYRSTCVITTGTSGTCTPLGAATCK